MRMNQIKVEARTLSDGSTVYDLRLCQARNSLLFAVPGERTIANEAAQKLAAVIRSETLDGIEVIEA